LSEGRGGEGRGGVQPYSDRNEVYYIVVEGIDWKRQLWGGRMEKLFAILLAEEKISFGE
jgi:hypothetical protein